MTNTIGVGTQLVPQSSNGWMTASVSRGGTLSFTVNVVNKGNVSEDIVMMSTGAGGLYSPADRNGDYLAAQPVDEFNGWHSFSPAAFTLPPGSRQLVTVTVNVPEDAPLGLQPPAAGVNPGLAWNTAWAFARPTVTPPGQVISYVASGVREFVTVT